VCDGNSAQGKMNVFIIPSWYPNPVHPIAGIFTREQAEAIADLSSDVQVIVSTWGHDAGAISVRKLGQVLSVLKWRLSQCRDQVTQRNSIWEVFNPALSWSHRLPFGGVRRLVEVNRRNFRLATEKFGKIDLLHAHVSYPAGYVASILSREFGIPYVLTEHMGPFPFPSLMHEAKPLPEIAQAFANAAEAIAVSPSLAKRIATFGYREPVVIPNVVDERRFSLGEPSSDKFVFFTLCGLTDQKGIDHLLEAIALWNPPADRFEFRMGGDGPMRVTYQALAERLGVADRVRWLGAVSREDAPRLFRECHIYVMPSRHETFGVVYAEAIASGKPIIATRCGGPEFIVNETNGRLVEIGDIKELSETMQQMAEHWNEFDPVAIRQDFERHFSRPVVVAQLRSLYESVIGA
jgi:glycosyltransferase involved in cell wall biosynthesis